MVQIQNTGERRSGSEREEVRERGRDRWEGDKEKGIRGRQCSGKRA